MQVHTRQKRMKKHVLFHYIYTNEPAEDDFSKRLGVSVDIIAKSLGMTETQVREIVNSSVSVEV